MGRRIGEIAVPTRYFEEASSVGFQRSVVYGLATLRVVARYMLHRVGVRRSPKLTARRPGRAGRPAEPGAGDTRCCADPPREPLSGPRSPSSRSSSSCAASTSRRRPTSSAPRDLRWIAVGFAFVIADLGMRGAALAAPRPPDPGRPLPPHARLPARRLPREQHPAGPAGRARPEPLPRRPGGDQPDVGARDGRRRAGRRPRRLRRDRVRRRCSS